MKKIIFISVLIIFTLTNAELYFPPYPYIDTKFTEEFELDKFNQIANGMTRKDVENSIGKGNPKGPFSMIPDKASGEITCIPYSDDGAVEPIFDFAWIGLNVCYDNFDLVTRTYEIIVQN